MGSIWNSSTRNSQSRYPTRSRNRLSSSTGTSSFTSKLTVLSALGVKVVKVANTKYSSFGGTIAKLKLFDGFDASVGEDKFIKIAEEVGCSIFENKGALVASGHELLLIMKKFVVPSIPLIAVSFLAKNIALGASIVIFDVKCGEGGLVKSKDDAYKLAKYMIEASKSIGFKCACVVTQMSQPTSASIGGVLELKEVIRSLASGDAYFESDMMKVAKEIVEVSLILSGKANGRDQAGEMFDECVTSGNALAKFKQIILAFGGTFDSVNEPVSILSNVATSYIESDHEGYLADIDTTKLIKSCMALAGDVNGSGFDKNAGVVMLVREGTKVSAGEKLARVYYGFGNPRLPEVLPDIQS